MSQQLGYAQRQLLRRIEVAYAAYEAAMIRLNEEYERARCLGRDTAYIAIAQREVTRTRDRYDRMNASRASYGL
jgi:hypothetical protein